jgi:hypothetical protein
MLTVNRAAERARWQLLWTANGKIQIDPYESDLGSALAEFEKRTRANHLAELRQRKAGSDEYPLPYPNLTLRCANMQFPPPLDVAAKMRQYNDKGVFWCPYCIKLRRFKAVRVRRGGTAVDPTVTCVACDVGLLVVTEHNPGAGQWLSERNETGRTKDPSKGRGAKAAARRRKAHPTKDDDE